MIKKLSKRSKNLAIVIENPIAESIKNQDQTSLISQDPNKQKIYEELIWKYDTLFRKLAKN